MYTLMMAVASNLASAFTQHTIPSSMPLLATRTRSVAAQQNQIHQHRLHRQRLAAVADPDLESAISTIYTASANVLLKPASEHTQPFWGTPDPFLSAGKSIAPTVQGLQELGISKQSAANIVSQAPEGLADKVQSAITKGWKILDSNNALAQDGLPGFSPTRSILAGHEIGLPAETPETFASQVEWSASFLNVVDKLPYIALAYALIEFFLLRPGVDLYQQDIDDEPERVLAETVLVTAVRMGVFAVVATVTVSIYG
jgi:hypothetical protein